MTTSLITGTLDTAIRDVLKDDSDNSREYLRATFLAAIADTMWRARNEAGLTQGDVAQKLGTGQSAIARLEADTEGKFTLHRFIDYCIAVGKFPLDIDLVPLETLQNFVRVQPSAPRSHQRVSSWQEYRSAGVVLAEATAPTMNDEELSPSLLDQGITPRAVSKGTLKKAYSRTFADGAQRPSSSLDRLAA